jgi:carbamoyltransferase
MSHPIVLGLHIGHHASCALVENGKLIAAIQQERVTRAKGDGQEGLSNRLPVHTCLDAAGISLDQVDLIVSSFQSASPGGIGLHRPLIERDFNLFDPRDERHLVVSHHHAHAHAALGASGLQDSAVLVCDLGGSTTRNGNDFIKTFPEFEEDLHSLECAEPLRTECLSIYEAMGGAVLLKHREYCLPHNTPDVFVQNVASLYDNVARMIFEKENAHGQLMALASMVADDSASEVKASEIVECSQDAGVIFRNDWQWRVHRHEHVLDYAPLANAVQRAFQTALMQYVRKTRAMVSSSRLVATGGVFLNILANSEILESGLFDTYYVPSSPHDAGIAVGAAFAGWRELARRAGSVATIDREKTHDRLGPSYDDRRLKAALCGYSGRTRTSGSVEAAAVAQLLQEGHIIARMAGRSEFGPRALGGRSLLASPLLADSKARLNAIKGRQPWRPVAPVTPRGCVQMFFSGPEDSPYMNFVHHVLPEHRAVLVALTHPDASTRVQTLDREDDPFLHDILEKFGAITNYPILVNTSLNGIGEPIVETPEQALEFFATHSDVDCLLCEDHIVIRNAEISLEHVGIAPDTIVSIIYPPGEKRVLMIRRRASIEISSQTFEFLDRQHPALDVGSERLDHKIEGQLKEALRQGFLTRGDR